MSSISFKKITQLPLRVFSKNILLTTTHEMFGNVVVVAFQNIFTRKYIKIIFFYFLKFILVSAHQKHIKKLENLKKK
jgi:hypothetical protein